MEVEPERNKGVVVPMVQKRLIDENDNFVVSGGAARHELAGTLPPQGFVSDKVNLLENGANEVIDKSLLNTPQKIHDPKRMKSANDDETSLNSTSATPLEGDRRRQ